MLTDKNASETYVLELFQRTGFKNTVFKKIDGFEDFGNFDLIFYNCYNTDIQLAVIESYVKNAQKNTMHFLFRPQFLSIHFTDHLSFSSVKSQIYGNLMNQLKYQDLIINFK